MTFDLRKFERVWDKAGERPEGIEYLRGWHLDGEPINSGSAAAIIRDWSVWWLAKQSQGPRCSYVVFVGDKFTREGHYTWSLDTDSGEFECDDRTEALYLACCAVLGIDNKEK